MDSPTGGYTLALQRPILGDMRNPLSFRLRDAFTLPLQRMEYMSLAGFAFSECLAGLARPVASEYACICPDMVPVRAGIGSRLDRGYPYKGTE